MPNLPNQSPSAGPPTPSQGGNFSPPVRDYSQVTPPQQWREPAPPMDVRQSSSTTTDRPEPQDPQGRDAASAPDNSQQQTVPPQSQSEPDFDQAPSNQDPQDQPSLGYNESAVIPGLQKPQPEEVLIEWQAASRPFKPRKRQHFTTVGLICVLIAMILFFAGQIPPVAVVIAVFFLYYVLNSTPPGQISHKLTTYGIRIEDTLYFWEELGRFWFTEKFGEPLLHIEVGRFPFRLTLLLGDIPKDDMQIFLSEILLFQKPPLTTYERVAKWLEEKLPIDMDAN